MSNIGNFLFIVTFVNIACMCLVFIEYSDVLLESYFMMRQCHDSRSLAHDILLFGLDLSMRIVDAVNGTLLS